mmetsp:Transcript_13859/g.29976  ORF Transcript_13859/g.29976 Transcript_13859/m.29976 type:complete len:238 (-) Transcript_13859:352-1065(-)
MRGPCIVRETRSSAKNAPDKPIQRVECNRASPWHLSICSNVWVIAVVVICNAATTRTRRSACIAHVNHGATDWARKLTPQPTLETPSVEHMPTRELLCYTHVFPTNNARAVSVCKVLLRGVAEQLVHRVGDAAISHKVRHALLELGEREVNITHNVQRQRIVHLHVQKERHIHHELRNVREQLVVERKHALCVPMPVEVCVRAVQQVPKYHRHQRNHQHRELKRKQHHHRRSLRERG